MNTALHGGTWSKKKLDHPVIDYFSFCFNLTFIFGVIVYKSVMFQVDVISNVEIKGNIVLNVIIEFCVWLIVLITMITCTFFNFHNRKNNIWLASNYQNPCIKTNDFKSFPKKLKHFKFCAIFLRGHLDDAILIVFQEDSRSFWFCRWIWQNTTKQLHCA